jgi:hypothetical protein
MLHHQSRRDEMFIVNSIKFLAPEERDVLRRIFAHNDFAPLELMSLIRSRYL